jgi:hypothetical protein
MPPYSINITSSQSFLSYLRELLIQQVKSYAKVVFKQVARMISFWKHFNGLVVHSGMNRIV